MAKLTDLSADTSLQDADLVMIVDVSNTSMDASGTNLKVLMSNLWAYIKTKADTYYQTILVSGTSLKTVNGTTLLGSGDLATPQGTVTAVSVATANGVSGSSSGGATPALTISLGAITPSSVNALTLASQAVGFTIAGGTTSKTLTVPLDASVSGTNTGDQDISGKLNISDIDDTPVNGETSAPISSNWAFDHAALASSDTVVGHVELAIASEVNTGTSTSLAVSPDGLAGSYAGTKSLSVQCFDGGSDVTTGDGKAYITIPESLNGMNLVRAQATVVTAGTTNATTVMIHNKTDAQDMLSGAISIASAGTVGTVGTINATYDDVATNDILRIDVDSVSTTAPKGLMVVLEFRLP